MAKAKPLVGILMGSTSDWEVMKQLGSMTVAYAVAEAEDPQAALALAQAALDEGKKAGQVVALIEEKHGMLPPEWKIAEPMGHCPECGAEAPLATFRSSKGSVA